MVGECPGRTRSLSSPFLPRRKSQTEKRRNLHATHWLIEEFARIYTVRKITFINCPWALLRVCASGTGHSAPPWPCLPLSSDPWTARHAGDSGQSHKCPCACKVSPCESLRHTSDHVSLPAGLETRAVGAENPARATTRQRGRARRFAGCAPRGRRLNSWGMAPSATLQNHFEPLASDRGSR